MKKFSFLLMVFALVIVSSNCVLAKEMEDTVNVSLIENNITVSVNEVSVPFATKPFIDNSNRTMVSVREFCEWLDLDVKWFEDTQTVLITKKDTDGFNIWFTIGEKQYKNNNQYWEMDTDTKLVKGKTYVPLRYLAEELGYSVMFNQTR